MAQIQYISNDGIKRLTREVKTKLEWYYNLTYDKENQSIIKTNEIRSSNIEISYLNEELIFDKNIYDLSRV